MNPINRPQLIALCISILTAADRGTDAEVTAALGALGAAAGGAQAANADYVLCPPALQSDTDTYHGYLEQTARDPADPGRLWAQTLPPMPLWLPKLQTPVSAAVQAGALPTDPFREVRMLVADGSLKWFKPVWSDASARGLAAKVLALPWITANYPDLEKLLKRYGY